jgi:hypothetical protein
VEHAAQGLGKLGLPDADLALEEEGLVQVEGEPDGGASSRVSEIGLLLEEGSELVRRTRTRGTGRAGCVWLAAEPRASVVATSTGGSTTAAYRVPVRDTGPQDPRIGFNQSNPRWPPRRYQLILARIARSANATCRWWSS